ncbi:hypothetical protein QA641_31660 [Bradyrhizobium sp. CB1650]|uniref:hypothetical protein n=1 Tax=Bradyrhizobium sp. CB1650 TaxID=3039153 RepID=UPI002435C872|nr:hypothetical protein [Bradyrhizobium sp. CB1650]WGD50144.1 hypothetical protein QA641_31660 [Bradyrhizobium sp. CB1650]
MSSIASELSAAPSRRMTKEEKRVTAAASLGTIFEWTISSLRLVIRRNCSEYLQRIPSGGTQYSRLPAVGH